MSVLSAPLSVWPSEKNIGFIYNAFNLFLPGSKSGQTENRRCSKLNFLRKAVKLSCVHTGVMMKLVRIDSQMPKIDTSVEILKFYAIPIYFLYITVYIGNNYGGTELYKAEELASVAVV